MAATIDLMHRLHEALAQRMLDLLDKEEITAAELGAISNFLKFNDIRSMPADDESVAALKDKIKARFGNSPVTSDLTAAVDDHMRFFAEMGTGVPN